MNKYNNTRPPRTGVIVLASVIFLSIMVIAFLNAYEKKAQALGHTVKMSPASVSYGTVSTARTSTPVVVPMQHTSPMMSRGTSYGNAYSSYTAMSKGSSSGAGLKVYTTSSVSAPVYSNGGGNAGGGAMGSTGASSSSHRGITRYGGVSFRMPALALATPAYASSSSETGVSAPYGARPRRVHSDGYGGYEGDYDGEPYDGQWWNEDDQEWVDDPFDGCIRYEGGVMQRYENGAWITVGNQGDPGVPVGDAPWFLMLLLLVAYAGAKALRMQRQK